MYIVLVKFVIADDYAEAFLKRVKQQAGDSLNREPDCHVFDVCADYSDNQRVMLYEHYTDRSAFKLHLASEHFKAFDEEVKGMIIDKVVEIYSLQ